MPPVSIGRIGYRIAVPAASQELIVYLDAGGRAGDYRVWGGLAALGRDELAWMQAALHEIRGSPGVIAEPDGEVKGKGVPFETAQSLGKRVLDEDHRIAFWAARHAPPDDPSVAFAKSELGAFLSGLRSHPDRLDQRQVNEWFSELGDYYGKLKPVNQHKIVAVVSHMQWLFAELKRTNTSSRLAQADFVVDRENFPEPVETGARLVKALLCSGLQSSGMSYRLTGRAMAESMGEGAVTVDIDGDSRSHAGLQFVDIMLQVVQRQLQPVAGVANGTPLDPQP